MLNRLAFIISYHKVSWRRVMIIPQLWWPSCVQQSRGHTASHPAQQSGLWVQSCSLRERTEWMTHQGTSRPATRGSYPHTATQDTLLGGASMVRHGTYCNIWCQKWVSSDSIAQFTRQLCTLHYIIFTLQHDIRKIIPKSSSLTSTNLRLHFCCKENSGSLGGRISVWQNVWVLHESCIQFYD